MKKANKIRIDQLLTERGLAESRSRAQALIMAGKVMVNTDVVDKAGKEVDPESLITVKEELPYVGRGGLKLVGALASFNIDAAGLTVIDVGSSTGGFTDCLLQKGAVKIYAIDVGRGIIDSKLRADARVVLMEGVNFRHLSPSDVPEKADLAVIDLSFISLEKILPRVISFMKEDGRVLALVKPQFEVGKGQLGKGGIVRDPDKHRAVVERIKEFSVSCGYNVVGSTESPITGAKGNKEFWVCLTIAPA